MKFILGFLAAVLVAVFAFSFTESSLQTLGSVNPSITVGGINAKTSVTSTARIVLAANTGRQGAEICNNGAEDAWFAIFPGSVTSTSPTSTNTNYFATSTGKLLNGGECWSLKRDESLPVGAVWAISSTTAQTIGTLEFSE